MINYLTQKEQDFLSAIQEDWQKRNEKSFLSVMFCSIESNNIRTNVQRVFEGYPERQIIGESDLIFECAEMMYIGKYKGVFWGTGSEGEFFSIRTELHQLPYDIFCNIYGYHQEPENAIDTIKVVKKVDYLKYVEDYKLFCTKFGWEYVEKFEEPNSIIQEFDKIVESLQ